MQDAKLVMMANQIAGFFRSYGPDVGVAGVRQHLQDFWTPAMLASLRDRVTLDASGLDPLVAKAISGDEAVATKP